MVCKASEMHSPTPTPCTCPRSLKAVLCLWLEGEEADLDDQSSNKLSIRERRRPRERRRGTGINFWTNDVSTLLRAGGVILSYLESCTVAWGLCITKEVLPRRREELN